VASVILPQIPDYVRKSEIMTDSTVALLIQIDPALKNSCDATISILLRYFYIVQE
jgi:hypothetical protein